MITTLKEYEVGFGYKNKLIYKKDVESIDDFKTSFLKRLGNVKGNCIKSEGELRKIKPIVKSEVSFKEMKSKINELDR